ncbi:hypothetical protein DSAG12_00171 [Promethearchaeum syntrophicum]|uniref:Uncharacterized protein n=1 Tax=Promethearchaeum syntrophicum TaxID=2594042 RepID=A0A5B9D5G6_9ARCH|nr:hypothetical protein [Candidatus Prometheoarchaeum syntrophicum]QEE14358.1 Presenilin [Candidatus Prometheoarchaeum syntrophicum]
MAQIPNSEPQDQGSVPKNSSNSSYGPLSFNEILGTFRIKLIHIYWPLLVCIISATFLSWLTFYIAGIDYRDEVVPYPDESNFWQVILNGLIPVLISAAFLVIIWILVKKFGLVVFKILMGTIVILYCWFGFTFFLRVIYIVLWDSFVGINYGFFNVLFYVLYYGSMVFYVILGFFYFRNRLSVNLKNMLVLSYGIFIGAIIGVSLPLWSIFSLAICFSIYDLIIVFKGPLGKIWQLFQDNQQKASEDIRKRLESGDLSEEEAAKLSEKHFLNNQETDEEEGEEEDLSKYIKDLKIELGSGDLIFYSALVAVVFITTNNWLTTLLVIIGVLFGAGVTIYFLLKKKRVLPALPFSMIIGIIMFFLGQLIEYLITIGAI